MQSMPHQRGKDRCNGDENRGGRKGGRTARWEWKDEAFQRRRVENKNMQGKRISRGRQSFIGIGPFYVKLWKQIKICVCTLLPQRLVIGFVTSDIYKWVQGCHKSGPTCTGDNTAFVPVFENGKSCRGTIALWKSHSKTSVCLILRLKARLLTDQITLLLPIWELEVPIFCVSRISQLLSVVFINGVSANNTG